MTKQTVYFAKKETDILTHYLRGYDKKEGYFFTPEELNAYTQSVIKQALETAAEKGYLSYNIIRYSDPWILNKESITNTFEETYKKFEV